MITRSPASRFTVVLSRQRDLCGFVRQRAPGGFGWRLIANGWVLGDISRPQFCNLRRSQVVVSAVMVGMLLGQTSIPELPKSLRTHNYTVMPFGFYVVRSLNMPLHCLKKSDNS
jgi:hypothetical protein